MKLDLATQEDLDALRADYEKNHTMMKARVDGMVTREDDMESRLEAVEKKLAELFK